jgi:hypothetical protein
MPLSCSETPARTQRDRYSPTLFTSTPHCARTGLAFRANRTSEKFLTAARPRAIGRFRQRASRSRRHSKCTATATLFDSGHRASSTSSKAMRQLRSSPSDDDGVVRGPAGKRGELLDPSDARGPIVGEPACIPVQIAIFGRRRKVRAAWQPPDKAVGPPATRAPRCWHTLTQFAPPSERGGERVQPWSHGVLCRRGCPKGVMARTLLRALRVRDERARVGVRHEQPMAKINR